MFQFQPAKRTGFALSELLVLIGVVAMLTLLSLCCVADPEPADEFRTSVWEAEQAAALAAEGGVVSYHPVFMDDPRLRNAHRLQHKVISGGMPDESSMQALEELGVKD